MLHNSSSFCLSVLQAPNGWEPLDRFAAQLAGHAYLYADWISQRRNNIPKTHGNLMGQTKHKQAAGQSLSSFEPTELKLLESQKNPKIREKIDKKEKQTGHSSEGEKRKS